MMKRKFIFGGVCATGIAAAAMLSVISCSGDDEFYEGGNYTLAKKRVTRGTPGDQGFITGPSVSYRAGSKNVEVSWNGSRLHFAVSWGEGFNTNDVHVLYYGADDDSGYQSFRDENNIERQEPNVCVVEVETAGPAYISNDYVNQSITIKYTQAVQKKDAEGNVMLDRGGCPIYTQSAVVEATNAIRVYIGEYRKPDTTY